MFIYCIYICYGNGRRMYMYTLSKFGMMYKVCSIGVYQCYTARWCFQVYGNILLRQHWSTAPGIYMYYGYEMNVILSLILIASQYSKCNSSFKGMTVIHRMNAATINVTIPRALPYVHCGMFVFYPDLPHISLNPKAHMRYGWWQVMFSCILKHII